MSRRGAVREYVGGALWVLPAIAVAVSLVAGAVLAQFEVEADSAFGRLLFQGDAGAARELLIVVSATMITVTGLVFSLTVVALQISSTQFSPRLLRSFLRDRGTQIVLSIFVSTFAYATAGLYTVGRLDSGEPYVPRIAISGSLLLALGSVGAIVWYLHHLAHSIQIDDVMRRIEAATLSVIARSVGGEPADGEPPGATPDGSIIVNAPTSGTCKQGSRRLSSGPPPHTVPSWSTDVASATTSWPARPSPLSGPMPARSTRRGPSAWPTPACASASSGRSNRTSRSVCANSSTSRCAPCRRRSTTRTRRSSRSSTSRSCCARQCRSAPARACGATARARHACCCRCPDSADLACGQLRRSSAHEPRVIGALLTMLAETRRRSSGDADHAAIQREIDLLHADAQRAILQPADLAVVTENRQQFMSPHPRP